MRPLEIQGRVVSHFIGPICAYLKIKVKGVAVPQGLSDLLEKWQFTAYSDLFATWTVTTKSWNPPLFLKIDNTLLLELHCGIDIIVKFSKVFQILCCDFVLFFRKSNKNVKSLQNLAKNQVSPYLFSLTFVNFPRNDIDRTNLVRKSVFAQKYQFYFISMLCLSNSLYQLDVNWFWVRHGTELVFVLLHFSISCKSAMLSFKKNVLATILAVLQWKI